MRDSILTIPINEIFEPKCDCPICRMRNMLEQRCVEYIMGAAMMEPDVRIATNEQGFCKTHFEQMRSQKNRLSLALMLHTHLQEVQSGIFSRKKLFESKNAKTRKISKINEGCFVCSKIEWGMERLVVTFFEMYEKSADFKALFREQEMLCMPHYDLLMSLYEENLQKKEFKAFAKDCTGIVTKYLESLVSDVGHYCNMYDYRNTGENADWGNSKDSIERAIKFLTSR